jgi:hypothetical protein
MQVVSIENTLHQAKAHPTKKEQNNTAVTKPTCPFIKQQQDLA